MTRSRWAGVVGLASLVAASCGQGNAIFNVDVLSFIKGSGDTIPYIVPPLTNNFSVSNVPKKISLVPGAGGSAVDTVGILGNVNFVNSTGSGTILLQIYVASDSASTYSASAAVFASPLGGNVSPNTTTSFPISIPNLSAKLDSLFAKSAIWFRMGSTLSNPGLTTVQGYSVLTALNLRVVVRPKLF